MMLVWEEIHGFTSPGEYTRFVQYIEGQVLGRENCSAESLQHSSRFCKCGQ
jgi:hypothetical protein